MDKLWPFSELANRGQTCFTAALFKQDAVGNRWYKYEADTARRNLVDWDEISFTNRISPFD